MENKLISIIIPNFNNGSWLERLFDSLKMQTYQNFEIVFVDDCSTDNSVEIAEKYRDSFFENRMTVIVNDRKRWNGGSRNVGLDNISDAKYIMYIDSDDYLLQSNVLDEITFLIKMKKPDCIKLSYQYQSAAGALYVYPQSNSVEDLILDCNVACWLKVLKADLVKDIRFPEDTLMEDVVYHLLVCDRVQTHEIIINPCIGWNRMNANSCSSSDGIAKSEKWKESLQKYYEDLSSLKLLNPICEQERIKRLNKTIENIKNNRYIQE